VPAGFQRRHGILLQQMGPANFRVVEVAGWANTIEIEGFFW
jgi:hypothetical protein